MRFLYHDLATVVDFVTVWIVQHPKVAVAVGGAVAAIVSAVGEDVTGWYTELGNATVSPE